LGLLADLGSAWLALGCQCGRTVYLPLPKLRSQHGPAARLDDLVARMRCSGCSAPPRSAQIVDDPQRDASGYVTSGPS
jgi:hypothetical protein